MSAQGPKCKELALRYLVRFTPVSTEERTFGIGSSMPQAAVSNPQQNSRVSYVAPLSEDIDLK
jgi:hypothetical protein